MEVKAQDYYDIDVDMLPGANFAGRPSCEIGMLDGLWTYMISSSSSSSEDIDNDNNNETPIATGLPDGSERWQIQPYLPNGLDRPGVTITSPSSDAPAVQLRSVSDDVRVLQRRRSRKKAQTAPPGSLSTEAFTPVEPRRAISVRMCYSGTGGGRVPQSFAEQTHSSMVELQAQLSSFGRKARVRRTLNNKQMCMLDTSLTESLSNDLAKSPDSILQTPRDLYGFVHPNTKGSSASPSIGTSAPTTAESFQELLQSQQQRIEIPELDNAAENGYDHRRCNVYVPGKIILARHSAQWHEDSVASMNPFDPGVDGADKDFFDLVNLEDTATFFDEFGIVDKATDECLDRYWLNEERESHAAQTLGMPSIQETMPEQPQKLENLRRSRFSFSSTSSSASEPSGGRTKRRLMKLLSPAMPASTFLKYPVSRGLQAEKS
ncbi:hypothetical protein ACN47E_003161 [Coniothyrium glycines]